MEALDLVLWPPTAWHWLVLGLVLISLEMMLGTYDLLWVAIAAAITSMFEALAPTAWTVWPNSLAVFAGASVVLFILGRTVFKSMRDNVEEHPTLNQRMASTIGKHVTAVHDFSNGAGRVHFGDTDWAAEAVDGANYTAGENLIVETTNGNTLIVRRP